MSTSGLLDNVRQYYSGRLAEFGATPRGVDWNSAESQELRFEQLLKLCGASSGALGDYGCGYGAMFEYLRSHKPGISYRGFDIAETMIGEARRLFGQDADRRFDTAEEVLAGCDWIVASGIFNVRLDAADADWEAYIHSTLDRLASLGRCGFAFNVLTSYSDPERMRPTLYYADACRLFDHCKRRYSRNVALLHDYGLYEFTIHVRN